MVRVGPIRLSERIVEPQQKENEITRLHVMKRMKSEHWTEILVHYYVLDSDEETKEKQMQTKNTISVASN